MKLVWLEQFLNLVTKGSVTKKSDDKKIRRVVKFEDCESITRRFASQFMAETSVTNQYFAALTVNIIALGVGASIGWASPFLPILQSADSPLNQPLTTNQASWVGSIFAFGALCGTLLFGWMSEKFGRFWAVLLTSIPQILWWVILMVGASFEVLFAGRFLDGLAAGGVFVLVPLYVSEISEDRVRGILGSFFMISINLGTLMMFLFGTFTSYSIVPRVMIAFPIIFAVTFIFLPETPHHLLKYGKPKEAENSLKYLRGCEFDKELPESIKNELLEMSKKIDDDETSKGESIFSKFASRASRKGLVIGLILVAVNQLCGCFAFINYTAEIFKESGSSLTPNMSAIIVAIIQVVGSVVSTFAIDNMSRKMLYAITCLGTIVGLLAMGTHGFLKAYYDVSNFAWVPIASLSFVIFIASIGLLPLTFIMLSEILPQEVRSFGASFCTAMLWAISFLLLRYFATLVAALQLHVCMFIFCGFTIFGMAFVIIYVPETRNRSNEQIERALSN